MKKLFTSIIGVAIAISGFSQSADVAINLTAADIGDNAGAADLEFGFDTASDQSTIFEYRAIIVKSSATFNLDSAQIVDSGNYVTYTAPLLDNVLDTLMSGATDSDGDAIIVGVSYNLYVFSVQDSINVTMDSLSAPSNSITLVDPMPNSIPFYEDFSAVATPSLPTGWATETVGTDSGFVTQGNSPGNFYLMTPYDGNYVFSNDDICNCDKSEDYLTLPGYFDFTAGDIYSMSFFYELNDAYDGVAEMQTSIDGGSSWSTFESLAATSSIDGTWIWSSKTMSLASLNGNSDVRFRFLFNDEGSYAFGLALDNILIDVTPDFDLGIVDLSANDYYRIPVDQTKQGFDFTANVVNYGINLASNVVVSLDINSQMVTSTPMNIVSGANTDISVSNGYILPGQGNYDFQMAVTMDDTDEVPGNNSTMLGTIRISDEIFSRGAGGAGALGGALESESNNEYGMVYEIFETDTASAIIIDLVDPDPSAEVALKIYEFEDGTGPTVEIATTDYVVLDYLIPGEIEPVRIPLNNFVPILPGKYLVTVIETSGSEPVGMTIDAADVFQNGVAWTKSSASSDAWSPNENFWVGDFYWPIRLELGDNDFTGVNDKVELSDFTVFPNPTDGLVNINEVSNFNQIEVMDMTGRTVRTVSTNGQHNVSLNVQDLMTGMYSVRVSNSETSITKKLSVK